MLLFFFVFFGGESKISQRLNNQEAEQQVQH